MSGDEVVVACGKGGLIWGDEVVVACGKGVCVLCALLAWCRAFPAEMGCPERRRTRVNIEDVSTQSQEEQAGLCLPAQQIARSVVAASSAWGSFVKMTTTLVVRSRPSVRAS